MFVFVMLPCLFLETLGSPAGRGLISWLSCVLCFFFCFVTTHKVSRLIVSVPDLCLPLYFTLRKLTHDLKVSAYGQEFHNTRAQTNPCPVKRVDLQCYFNKWKTEFYNYKY